MGGSNNWLMISQQQKNYNRGIVFRSIWVLQASLIQRLTESLFLSVMASTRGVRGNLGLAYCIAPLRSQLQFRDDLSERNLISYIVLGRKFRFSVKNSKCEFRNKNQGQKSKIFQ